MLVTGVQHSTPETVQQSDLIFMYIMKWSLQ